MRSTVRVILSGIGFVLVTGLAAVAAQAEEGYSHVRIVRLSFTEGDVTIQRPDLAEWASAPTNTPIQEGFKLSTAEAGYAEVEFENSSTARVGQLSLLEFTQLALTPGGGKLNRMTLHQGYATFNVIPDGDDYYEVTVARATVTPHGKCRFRVDYDQGLVQVKVFKGSVEVVSPEGNGTLGKNSVLLIDPGAAEPFQLAQGITKDAWDEWVEERENRVQLARSQVGPAPYSAAVPDLLYGWMDLLSYGNWYMLPGYGWGWAPMVGYGWAPFTFGRWCWYPGFGYVWISGEPWGWLPYHYGSWIYMPGYGWCWLPGSFGYWSPGIVTWYQGPGWVGWSPRSPHGGGGQTNCPEQGCITRVDDTTVRQGLPVRPERVSGVDPRDGRRVERPDVRPDRLGMLPGPPQAEPAVSRRGRGGELTGEPLAGSERPGRPQRLAQESTREGDIVFDSVEGQYVNRSGRRTAPEASAAPMAQAASALGTLGRVGRPGPRQNYPEPDVLGPLGVQAGTEERPVSPGSGDRRGWLGTWSAGESNAGARSGSLRGVGRSGDSSRPRSSRPAPSVSPRSESRSRSSGTSVGSSRSDRSGGFSGSSHSSGSWGGSSGGGSHSSGSASGIIGGGSRGSGGSGGSSGGGSRSSGSSGPRH
jgi:hypothetical protein